ncbi:MAG: molybdopterin-dependent oxidoreductase [Acidobacteriota bacterium]
MPKITINEQEIDAKDGQTIIQAAHEHGIDIPHYCYHQDLPIDGNCRMCLVEVEKMPKLTPSCATVCSEGMKVTTNNERVKMAVRGVLEFLLINHPVDCPVCDQAGECRLQDYYMVYGLHTSEIPMDMKVHKLKAVDLGQMVMLDQERCILCSRCIRFFEHVTGTGELQFFGRGDHTVIGTLDNRRLDNPYSGNVVDLCPVGALTSHDFRFKCRVWFLHSTDSVCNGCSTGCNIRIDHRDGTIFRTLPRRNAEVNKSWLCDEGRLSFHNLSDGERIVRPKIKGEDGMQAPARWEEALRAIDINLKDCKAAFGANAVIGFASPSATNEALYLFKKYLGEQIGTTHFEFRLDSEDKKVTEKEDDILRHLDKHSNSMGALKLGLANESFGGIKGAIDAAKSGKLKAGVIVYFKPLVRRDSDVIEEAQLAEFIKALAYSVVFTTHQTDWLANANVVLPVAAWSEEEGTYTNFQGRVQYAGKAIRPQGDAIALWEALAELLNVSGDTRVWMSPDEIFTAITETIPAFAGINYQEMRWNGAETK